MNAKKMLSDSGLDDLVLNKKNITENTPESFWKRFYASDMMEAYFKSKTCETCKYLNNENNYCPIIEQFNDVEFGCINHCS